MKTFHAIALATALTIGAGSMAFAAETAPAGTPNANTSQTPTLTKSEAAKDGKMTTGSGVSSTSTAKGGTIAPGTPLSEKEKADHKTVGGGPAVGK